MKQSWSDNGRCFHIFAFVCSAEGCSKVVVSRSCFANTNVNGAIRIRQYNWVFYAYVSSYKKVSQSR